MKTCVGEKNSVNDRPNNCRILFTNEDVVLNDSDLNCICVTVSCGSLAHKIHVFEKILGSLHIHVIFEQYRLTATH